jgi:hypothetical protein
MFETPEGFLVCVGVKIARTGTMEYHEKELDGAGIEGDQNGMIQIYRDEKEVFRPATIKSFEGKPFTITHPKDLVSPDNWSELAHGIMQNVRRGKDDSSEDLITDLLVTSSEAIELIKTGGMREVSCGYEADYEQTSPGKGVQTNIIGNHLALVEQGRAGSSYAINDHKGARTMNIFEKLLKPFAKDPEALKVMKALTLDAKRKTDDEDMETDDEMPGWAADMKKSVDALNATVANMAQPTTAAKDADKEAAEKMAKEKAAKDADPMAKVMDAIDALCKRMDAMEGKTDDEDVDTEDDDVGNDVVSDEDGDEDEGEETGDEAGMEVVSGDTASRVEIIAPGLELEDETNEKKSKIAALKTCFATKDGKRIISALNGGKAPLWTYAKTVDRLFIATSEVLKAKRTRDTGKTKFADQELIDGTPESKVMTAEKMNELNAKYYKQTH